MSRNDLYIKILFILTALLAGTANGRSQNTVWYYEDMQAASYQLKSSEDFKGFVSLLLNGVTDFKGVTIELMCDLDMTSFSERPDIFCTFKGNGHTVKNRKSPLFNRIEREGTVENLRFDSSCAVSNYVDAGMVAVKNYGTVRYCESAANISLNVTNEYAHLAGICAYNYGKIIGCVNRGDITLTQSQYVRTVQRAGGISTINQSGVLAGCENYGNVKITTRYYGIGGGIAADMERSSAVNCSNYGDVTVKLADSSGISASDIILYAGGISAEAGIQSALDQCRNYGKVTSNAQYVGGICGQVSNTSLSNLANYGDVESVEATYYSCAAGITGYVHNITNRLPFVNCVNFGNVSSKARSSSATASGISMEIVNAVVANLLNFSTVSANTYGGIGSEFVIMQYETENCDEINCPASLAELQAFVDENETVENICLVNWEERDGQTAMGSRLNVYVDPSFARANVYLISGLESPTTDMNIIRELTGESMQYNSFLSDFTVTGLMPDETYSYSISANGETVNGRFATRKPTVNVTTSSDDFFELACQLSSDCDEEDVEGYGVYYKLDTVEEYRWSQQMSESTGLTLENLFDGAKYSLRPYITVGGQEYFGNTVSAATREIVLDVRLEKANLYSLEFLCENYDEVSSLSPGIIIGEKSFPCSGDGRIVADGLRYNTSYECVPAAQSIHGVREMTPITASTANSGTGRCLQLSSTAAMASGLVPLYGSKTTENHNMYYNRVRFEYRRIDDAVDTPSQYVMATQLDVKDKLFAATIPFEENGLYQYRTVLDNTSYNNYRRIGEWVLAGEENSDRLTPVVEPLFYSIYVDKDDLMCALAPGEEELIACGVEYHVEGSDNVNSFESLSLPLTSFVSGVVYKARFFAKTPARTYYSEEVTFDRDGNFVVPAPEDPEESGAATLTVICPNDGIFSVVGVSSFELTLPEEARFNSILLNGLDITDYAEGQLLRLDRLYGDNKLAYSIEIGETSGYDERGLDGVKVYGARNMIYVSGHDFDSSVMVYDLNGLLVADSFDSAIPVEGGAVYVVRIASRTFKLFIPS